ncbi:MAG: hypothetical protein EB120_08720, partial [Proteobacteria bacterium]|nr:hypothetical protein [Pseudomonadota bacterium]
MLSKNSTRVTLLGPSWPFRGGIPKYTTRLAKELYQRENLVDFITSVKQYPSFLYPGKTDRETQACQNLDFANPLFSYLEPWTWAKVPRAIHLKKYWRSRFFVFQNIKTRYHILPLWGESARSLPNSI